MTVIIYDVHWIDSGFRGGGSALWLSMCWQIVCDFTNTETNLENSDRSRTILRLSSPHTLQTHRATTLVHTASPQTES